MAVEKSPTYSSALEDFRQARRRASLQQLMTRLTGKSSELLDYEDVRRRLKATNTAERGLHDIPLDQIIGSVGRAKDFTRTFLPKRSTDEERWARVKTVMTDMSGLPPIEVYKVGDAYFVIDGNHRVSIARDLGAPTIQAYVTEVKTRVPLSPQDDLETLISKERYAEFLEQTNLDNVRPDADLQMTLCGKYRLLLEHIDAHHYFMGIDFQRDVSYEEAVAHWYDTVYLPVIRLIHEYGLLHDFPELTETDLYALVAEHQAELKSNLGWTVRPETAATDLADQKSTRPERILSRVGEKLVDVVVLDEFETGPPPGEWRRWRAGTLERDRLFRDVLVAIRGKAEDWRVLEQAFPLARLEGSRLLGLHVIDDEQYPALQETMGLSREAVTAAVQAEFERRCREAKVNATLAIEQGSVARRIVARSRYADLVLLTAFQPALQAPLVRLKAGLQTLTNSKQPPLRTGLQTIIKRCPRPIMGVPTDTISSLDRPLLAYDGSPMAREALFIATYWVMRHSAELSVLSVNQPDDVLQEAQDYLAEREVTSVHFYNETAAHPSDAILKTAVAHDCNLFIMGGYSTQPLVQVVLGSTVDRVLRQSPHPVLICR